MKFEELIDFIEEEHGRLMNLYELEDEKDLKHPITIKIMEELGELCEDVLSEDSF